MSVSTAQQWEEVPDRQNIADLCRLQLPGGWLVSAWPPNSPERASGPVYYPDSGHRWNALEEERAYGTHQYFEWEYVHGVPIGTAGRLRVPHGWLVITDDESRERSTHLTFCPDANHEWS